MYAAGGIAFHLFSHPSSDEDGLIGCFSRVPGPGPGVTFNRPRHHDFCVSRLSGALHPSRVIRRGELEELRFPRRDLVRFARLPVCGPGFPILPRGVAADGSPFSARVPPVDDFEWRSLRVNRAVSQRATFPRPALRMMQSNHLMPLRIVESCPPDSTEGAGKRAHEEMRS